MTDDRGISSTDVAVLAERVDTLINNYSKIEGMIIGISSSMNISSGDIGVLKERITNLQDANGSVDEILRDTTLQLRAQAKVITSHATIWKIVGASALVSVGAVGWMLGQISLLHDADASMDKRIYAFEYTMGSAHKDAK